jgi:hypothetical protein
MVLFKPILKYNDAFWLKKRLVFVYKISQLKRLRKN